MLRLIKSLFIFINATTKKIKISMSLGFYWTFCSTGKNQNLVIYIGPFSSALCGIDPYPNLCQ